MKLKPDPLRRLEPPVEDREVRSIGAVTNYYGGLGVIERGGRFYWTIEDFSGYRCEEIPAYLHEALCRFEDERHGASALAGGAIVKLKPDPLRRLEPPVEDREVRSIGAVTNYYGGLGVIERGGRFYWTIEDFSGYRCEEIPAYLHEALCRFEDERHGASLRPVKPGSENA